MRHQDSWLDRAIMEVAPQWGLRRARARVAAGAVRHYEAATLGRRTENWGRNALDANGITRTSIHRLRELARDLYRNNGWARRGVDVIGNNTIGWGITPSPATGTAKSRAKRASALWKDWAESTTCDVDGRHTFHGLMRLAMRTTVLSGEALAVRRWDRESNALGMQIHVLEPDYIDSFRDGIRSESGGLIIQGIEFDQRGRRVAYWLFDRHPGAIRQPHGYASRRVPVEDVIHVYRVERPGQVRGVSWLAAAIVALEDLGEYEDASLVRQKIAACFSAFVTDNDLGASVGEQDPTNAKLETLEPGMISYLPPGREITFANPPAEGGYDHFTKAQLRRVAASMGVTYEDLTGDYSQSNFSSARMSRISHWANVHDWQWHMIIPQFCDPVWRWAMQAAAIAGEIDQIPRAQWSPPPMPMIEPDREGLAYARLIRAGVLTLPEAVRERGKDFSDHIAEYASGNAELDRLGIWLDSDPRRTSAAGVTQARAGIGDSADEEDGEGASSPSAAS